MAVLTRHRARVAQHGAPARSFADFASYQTWQRDLHRRTAEYRRARGLSLVERYIEARYTADRADLGRAFILSVRAHPEWYEYASGAGDESSREST